MTTALPPVVDIPALDQGLPTLSGWETEIRAALAHPAPVFLPQTNIRWQQLTAGFAIALHMHQPTIPAGTQGALINHLQ